MAAAGAANNATIVQGNVDDDGDFRRVMNAVSKILLVDDDTALRQSLAEQLERDAEFAVVECDTGSSALDAVKHERFDAMLLDVGLPDMDGRELCREFRRSAINVPILMLTAADSENDTVQGLDAGADDYVTKPFRLNVLLARLRAHLRQSAHRDDAVFSIGPYTFQPGAKLLTDPAKRKKVRLTEKETAILRYLYHAGDRPIGRATLLGEVWGYNAGVTTHTLETHVYRLRQKIERDPANAEILITEAGGYRLQP
jgi:DNA-binding response OmpR family regulator